MWKKKRILIVDDYPQIRDELRSLLSANGDFDIVGEAADGQEAFDCVIELGPDLVLMDISMPRMNGLEATRKIKEKRPKTKILALTINNSPEYVSATLEAGADGYLTKDAGFSELIQSIENIFYRKKILPLNNNSRFI